MKTYYAEQTHQALENFPFPLPVVSLDFIYPIIEVKKAAAKANMLAGNLESLIEKSIEQACDEILAGEFDDQFVTPSVQGGAGTSINMNCNEVIATRASEIMLELGSTLPVHPNDHVNMSQSTNDVNPSALRICLIRLTNNLISELEQLSETFLARGKEYATVRKLGRTHYQDAVPTTMGAEFDAYAAVVKRDVKRLKEAQNYLYELNLGGTAIGNCINASPKYQENVYKELKELTGFDLKPMQNLMAGTSSTGDFCHISSLVTGAAVNLSKIATDIRFMASGPKGGIGEITLQALQPGSSIMPGKINPVAAESINQISYFISGKNLTVHQATDGACMELAVMFPVIAESVISSIQLLAAGVKVFRESCIATLVANKSKCEKHLEESMAYGTLFTPVLGYEKVSAAVKEAIASGITFREAMVGNNIVTEEEFNKIITS